MTKEERLLKIAEWRLDIKKFFVECFPHHFSKGFCSFHDEVLENLKLYPRLAIAAMRGHGKTSIITFGWVMYKILLNPNSRFIILIGSNYANAVRFLEAIKKEIEENVIIKEVFGNLQSDKWSENEIELKCNKKILCGGNDFKIKGQKYLQWRPDTVILDDSEDDELLRSQERRENFEYWFNYALEPAMASDNNQIIFVGTIAHRDCILAKLMDGAAGKYKDWKSFKYKALIENETKAIWPEQRSFEWLINEKNKDPHKFYQEYMSEPSAYEHAMFKAEYFDNYADSQLPKNLIINITVDLACSDKNYSDYTVIMPVGVDTQGDLWVLPYVRGRYIDPDEIINLILTECAKYSTNQKSGWKFGKLGIEKVAFQRFLIRPLIKERKKRGMRIVVTELEAKGDKTQRIGQLQPWFAAGDIHIRENMLDLKEELLDFPRGRHDDAPDALAYHLSFVNQTPLREIITSEKFSVTPEKQRQKIMKNTIRDKRIKIYTGF